MSTFKFTVDLSDGEAVRMAIAALQAVSSAQSGTGHAISVGPAATVDEERPPLDETPPKPKARPKAKPKAEPKAKPEAVTEQDLRTAATRVKHELDGREPGTGTPAVMSVVQLFGTKKLSDVPEDRRAEAVAKLEALLDG